jgi:23S rRNA pseudouridine1911/1915/1917 synthase
LIILYEDDDLLVADKPAGVVVHPSYKNPSGTLLDALMSIVVDWPPGRRPSIVGRLDKFTSGLVVVAKHAAAHTALQRALSSRDAQKIYLAVVRGVPPEAGTIDLALAHDPNDRRRRMVSADGAPSVTEFERIETGRSRDGDVALLRCRLRSGRRHQIRVHLAAQGWPILGDSVYGEPLDGAARHALHAWRVSCAHPSGAGRVEVESAPPADFWGLLPVRIADWGLRIADCGLIDD